VAVVQVYRESIFARAELCAQIGSYLLRSGRRVTIPRRALVRATPRPLVRPPCRSPPSMRSTLAITYLADKATAFYRFFIICRAFRGQPDIGSGTKRHRTWFGRVKAFRILALTSPVVFERTRNDRTPDLARNIRFGDRVN